MTVVMTIDFTISYNCHEIIEMVQQLAVYTFVHLFIPQKSNNEKLTSSEE